VTDLLLESTTDDNPSDYRWKLGLTYNKQRQWLDKEQHVQEQQYALKHLADTKLQMDSVRRSHTFANKQQKPSKRKQGQLPPNIRHKVYLQSAEDVVKTLILFSSALPEMLHATNADVRVTSVNTLSKKWPV